MWMRFRLPMLLVVGVFACTLCMSGSGAVPATGPATQPAIHWEKWTDDLFDRAKREHKFVYLDLEAVWCHWCHVMDDITYRDPDVVRLMNERYIAVKVDQDARPDLSNRYEDYGWPATVVFNAEGGEIVKRRGYIPPGPMARLLQAIIDDPTPGPSVEPEAKVEFATDGALTPALRKELEATLEEGYDEKEGGWGTVHKFIDWDAVELLMDRARSGDAKSADRAKRTLTQGLKLIDPVWGGVYQYSTDGDWVHPHFEKIMNFQAEILRAYSLAYAQWHDPAYLKGANDIGRYMRSFLKDPASGAFYVSQDADLIDGEHSGDYFALDDAARRKQGVPRIDTHRYARDNGWAIEGLVAWHAVTRDPETLAEAKRAAEWVIANRAIEGSPGGFRHDQHDAGGPFLADTLNMGRAFLALYAATGERAWLERAQQSADFIASHFAGAGDGKAATSAGLATAAPSARNGSAGTLAPKPQIDENVAAVRFLNLLGHYTGKADDKQRAGLAMRYLATPQVARSRNLWIAGILLADRELATEPLHVTVVGAKSDATAGALFATAGAAPQGYKRLEWWDPSEGPLMNADVEYPKLKKPAAFLCTGSACSSPMTDPRALANKLQ